MFTSDDAHTGRSSYGHNASRQPTLHQLSPVLAKKRREKALRYKKQATSEKYLPPKFRSNTQHTSIADTNNSASPTSSKPLQNDKLQVKVVAAESLHNLNLPAPVLLQSPSRHQDLEMAALQSALNLQTSSNKQIELKRKIGAAASSINRFILTPSGTAPLHQTESFSFRERTKLMVCTGVCVVAVMITFVAILAVMGYSG